MTDNIVSYRYIVCTYDNIYRLLCIFSKQHVNKNITIINTESYIVLHDNYAQLVVGFILYRYCYILFYYIILKQLLGMTSIFVFNSVLK